MSIKCRLCGSKRDKSQTVSGQVCLNCILTKSELAVKLTKLARDIDSIEQELKKSNPFSCHWTSIDMSIRVDISESRREVHNRNKVELTKSLLKLLNDELKETENKLKKLLK